jgi:thymidylate synthase
LTNCAGWIELRKKNMKKDIVHYKPYTERIVDTQYENLIGEILKNGDKKTSYHARAKENKDSDHRYCLELPARQLQFYVPNGAPITPIRDLGKGVLGAIGEMIGFINGARTLKELVSYGCPQSFWAPSVTEEKCAVWGLREGDLGPGSYGPTFTNLPLHPTPWWHFGKNKKTFNQITALNNQIKTNPFARTNLISSWYTPLAMGDKTQGSPRKVVVAPCHGNLIQVDVMDDRSMRMTVYQRSSDSPVGLVYNLTQWFAFGLMVAYVGNLEFRWYTHLLPNPQVYDIQFEAVKELLGREPKKLPSLYLNPKRPIESLTDFRKEDFELEDYTPHPKLIIPSVV